MAEVRIISHMNKDHKLSIEDYLVVYGNVIIDSKISNIRMTHIDLNQMTISFKHQDIEFDIEKVIRFEPPLENLMQARVKLVEMAKFASAKRGFSHFQVSEYRYPKFTGWLLILLIHLPILVWIFPSLLLNKYVLSVADESFIKFVVRNGFNVFLLTTFIHAFEVFFVLKPKLQKYRVPTDYKLEWYIAGVIEGYPAIKRLNAAINDKEH